MKRLEKTLSFKQNSCTEILNVEYKKHKYLSEWKDTQTSLIETLGKIEHQISEKIYSTSSKRVNTIFRKKYFGNYHSIIIIN